MKNDDVAIFDFHENEFNDLYQIELNSFDEPWSRDVFIQEMLRPYSNIKVANINGETVGFVVYWAIFEEYHILNIAVSPKFRNQGIGQQLLSHVMIHAKNNNAHRIVLEVRTHNESAIKLYKKNKFQISDTKKNYYSNGDDAYSMIYFIEY